MILQIYNNLPGIPLKIAEKFRTDADTGADGGVMTVVLQQAFPVAVVVLNEEELIFAFGEAIAELHVDIVAENRAGTPRDCHGACETAIIGNELRTDRINPAIFQDILIVHSVDYRDPRFAVHHQVSVDEDTCGEGYLVPRARVDAVASVTLMLYDEGELPDESVAVEKRLGDTYAGIEIQVGEGHRVLQKIPECLLGVEQIKIRTERQGGAGKLLRHRYLEFYVGVFRRGPGAYRSTEDEIIVLIEPEVGSRVIIPDDGIASDYAFRRRCDYLGRCRGGQKYGYKYQDDSLHSSCKFSVAKVAYLIRNWHF